MKEVVVSWKTRINRGFDGAKQQQQQEYPLY